MNKYTLALIGNQNSGKTTLFNQLTGSNQHVGNFPGVTVEKKEGIIKKNKNMMVVDLPGIYSLSPYSIEEIVTRDFLLKEKPDLIINIADATNIERNLYLTLQLLELNIPMVLALNMIDEVTASGNFIDVKEISRQLKIPVVPISAVKNQGIDELLEAITNSCEHNISYKYDFCSGEVHKAIHSVVHIIDDNAKAAGIPVRFAATKLIEGETKIAKQLNLSDIEIEIINEIKSNMEKVLQCDSEAILADMRYDFIEKLCKATVTKNNSTKQHDRSVKLDRLLTHKYLGIPIFIGFMSLIFWLTFGVIGSFISDLLSIVFDFINFSVTNLLELTNVSEMVKSLIVDGAFAGIFSVLSFLPTIIVLFFFLSVLEDTGYMARVAFVMDKILRNIGLSGKSFVPMLIGFGCSVPAIMATRTLSSKRDRLITIIMIPFMSCSAKLPIYAVFTAAFFKGNEALVMIILYLFGMIISVLTGLLLKSTVFKGESAPFVMELPSYRLPSLRTMSMHMWEKAKDFLIRAFTVIFVASIVIWALQSLDLTLNFTTKGYDSILAKIGGLIAPVFAPLGFNDYRAATALVTGFTAKEAVVSTLAIITGAANKTDLLYALQNIFTPITAFSFLCFTLLYMPCVAAFAAIKREVGGFKGAVFIVTFQTVVAYVFALFIYNLMKVVRIMNMSFIDYSIILVIIGLVIFAISRIKKNKGKCSSGCEGCSQIGSCNKK